MRIGIVTKWLDEQYTGVGRYTYRLIKALLDIDKENEYFFIHRRGGKCDLYRRGTEIFLPDVSLGPMWIFSSSLFLSVRKKELDLVHEPYLGFLLPTDFKQVMTVHDLAPLVLGMSHPTFNIYFKTLMGRAVRNADAVITDSDSTRRDVIEYYGADEDKVKRVYLGVEPEDAEGGRLERVRKRFDIGGPYILSVASLVPTKNLSTAVLAYSRARKEGRMRHKLVLAGKKDIDYERLRELVGKEGLEDSVVFTDYLDWKDVVALYSGADLYLFPTLYEGFGYPPLEAMYHGVPVIASNSASVPEVVGDAGIVLPPDDIEGWGKAILDVLGDNGLRKKLVARGKGRLKMFTVEKCARGTLDIYKGVMHD